MADIFARWTAQPSISLPPRQDQLEKHRKAMAEAQGKK
jgi:hypothetical protein